MSLPIESHGLIGNMRTAALVGTDGTIDWLCFPRFDSPSVFASILDDEKGGHFRLAPAGGPIKSKQFYWPATNVLVTRFATEDGGVELHDFMPVDHALAYEHHQQIVRRVTCFRGRVTMHLDCTPAFDYARERHEVELCGRGAIFRAPGSGLVLETSVPLVRTDRDGVAARFQISEGEHATFVLRGSDGNESCGIGLSDEAAEDLFRRTVVYWRSWLAHCSYRGRWRETVERSALTLKMLTYEPTGAIVAAPTCSLPERLGGTRNWDYRYTWMRDAAFTVYGFLRIGFTEEANAFMEWLDHRYKECSECARAEGGSPLALLYRVDGDPYLPEQELSHLDGHCGSRPVRIGNGAVGQLQLDIYGELLDAVYLFNKYARPLSYDSWQHLRRLMDWLGTNWRRPDEGIWEPRSGPRQSTNSKLMCWVAFDRALRLADKRSFPAPRDVWLSIRDEIYETIFHTGWNAELESFVGTLGGKTLDAATLLMPLVFFVAPDDPRMLKTLEAIRRPPRAGGLTTDGLVYRYRNESDFDGIPGDEGTFNMCSFWLVEAMTRAGRADKRMLEEARLLFERMIGYGNHVGLFSEETGDHGEALGNFPQAFTHLSLISAAFNLNRVLG